MNDPDLYPCPFCQSDLVSTEIADEDLYAVCCFTCGAQGPLDPTEEEARSGYNVVAELVSKRGSGVFAAAGGETL